ncbi:hypothetical protein PFAG_05624 [Plasmodium falciparum Santa Lucia]|uniref:Uncharacterized protein n=3 Tax=Plasmodium falciparum TaxID=5833 RepID=A0A024VIL9_PLAFA|nr:hypothetical protein PFFVO_05156 [Plasmodium falciparum Vietnam Oak-Knoll (FVO)]ETW28133.1 hypothetical protein PFFCH_04484 [Plasmodium falciparum FCH/4]EUT79051.1 hypothetical protein PFAG_05624 [Plasmodium falciparum Santa Lucia]
MTNKKNNDKNNDNETTNLEDNCNEDKTNSWKVHDLKYDEKIYNNNNYKNDCFSFFRNIKIVNNDKSVLSNICCTYNYLFVSTFNKVYIFNFDNILNIIRENENQINKHIINKDITDNKKNMDEEDTEQMDGIYINNDNSDIIKLKDVYKKNTFFNDEESSSDDDEKNTLFDMNTFNKLLKKYNNEDVVIQNNMNNFNFNNQQIEENKNKEDNNKTMNMQMGSSNPFSNEKMNDYNIMENNNYKSKIDELENKIEKLKNELSKNSHNNNNINYNNDYNNSYCSRNLFNFNNLNIDLLNNIGFREEYLYYDNYLDTSSNKKKENINGEDEKNENDENKKNVQEEEDEELKKKKMIEDENNKNEELKKKGFYINNNYLEINIDLLKYKTKQNCPLLEYIGSLKNVSSPILMMKNNKDQSILTILTYNGSVYNYNISENALNYLKERRNEQVDMLTNMEYYLMKKGKMDKFIDNRKKDQYDKGENASNNILGLQGPYYNKNDIEQKINNYHENDEQDDEEEDVSLSPLSICISYFTFSIKCFDFLFDDKTIICVGSNKDYFLSFINCKNGKQIIYDKKIKIQRPKNNMNINYTLIYDFNFIYVDKEKKQFNGHQGHFVYLGTTCGYLVFIFISEHFYNLVNDLLTNDNVKNNSLFYYDEYYNVNMGQDVSQYIIGNAEDIYKIDKKQLYTLFDDTEDYVNKKNTFFFDDSKENIFKNVPQNFFSYAFYISKNAKVNSIISVNTKSNKNIHIIIGLNDGRFITFIFQICPNISCVTIKNNYSISNQNYIQNETHDKLITQENDINNEDNNTHSLISNNNNNNNNNVEHIDKFITKSEKIIYDFTGLHQASTIRKMNFYYQSFFQKYFIFINSNIKKINEMSDKNFYTTYIFDIYGKKIDILYQHLSYIIDSCISSSVYFCLEDNNTISVFSLLNNT